MQPLARLLRPCRALVLYPYTWAVLALILVTHLSFSLWFQPATAMQRLALGFDLLALLLWGVLALRSEAWRSWHNRMPYETTPRQVQKVLTGCPPAFAIPATSRTGHLDKQYRPPGPCPSYVAPARPTLWDA
jgi:hypothetical protein